MIVVCGDDGEFAMSPFADDVVVAEVVDETLQKLQADFSLPAAAVVVVVAKPLPQLLLVASVSAVAEAEELLAAEFLVDSAIVLAVLAVAEVAVVVVAVAVCSSALQRCSAVGELMTG